VILLLLFVVVPIAELYTIIRVGASIGFLNTLALIIAVGFVGSWLVKREGMRTWVRFNQTLASGQIPAKEMVDGVLILGAGALLLTPGFLSDVFGILRREDACMGSWVGGYRGCIARGHLRVSDLATAGWATGIGPSEPDPTNET